MGNKTGRGFCFLKPRTAQQIRLFCGITDLVPFHSSDVKNAVRGAWRKDAEEKRTSLVLLGSSQNLNPVATVSVFQENDEGRGDGEEAQDADLVECGDGGAGRGAQSACDGRQRLLRPLRQVPSRQWEVQEQGEFFISFISSSVPLVQALVHQYKKFFDLDGYWNSPVCVFDAKWYRYFFCGLLFFFFLSLCFCNRLRSQRFFLFEAQGTTCFQ